MQFPLKFKYILPMTNPLGNKIYLIVGLLIILAVAVLAFFLFPNLTKEKETAETTSESSQKFEIYGTVHEIDADAGIITIEEIGTGTEYQIKISGNTKFSEIGTGNSFNFADISIGQTLQIVTSKPKGSGGASGGGTGSGGGGQGGSGSGGDGGIIVIDDDDDEINVYPKDPSTLPKIGKP